MNRVARRPGRLKTLGQIAAGRSTGVERHVHQFQIACLELERTRRLKELAAATLRTDGLHRRLGEIDREIERHRQDMGPIATPETAPAPAPETVQRAQPASSPQPPQARPRAKRRTLRY